MFQKVEALRSTMAADAARTDVVHTPKADDFPHADFALFDTGKEDIRAIRDWLQRFIQVVRPEKLDAVSALRPQIDC